MPRSNDDIYEIIARQVKNVLTTIDGLKTDIQMIKDEQAQLRDNNITNRRKQ